MTRNGQAKIFLTYFYPTPVFRSELMTPIQADAARAAQRLDMIGDHTGDHISEKNHRYGELTAMYWVWKNWLPQNPRVEHIGFFQYRRLLDLCFQPGAAAEQAPRHSVFQRVNMEDYRFLWDRNCRADLSYLRDYDLVMSPKHRHREERLTLEEQYRKWHPERDLDIALSLIEERCPKMKRALRETLKAEIFYFTLVFVMRRAFFESFMAWLTALLTEVEKLSDWSAYDGYHQRRLPAFLGERLLNVWIAYQIEANGLRVLERPGCLLDGVKPDEPLPTKPPTPLIRSKDLPLASCGVSSL
ncbi:MAG: DUF4422 domain-containing protein [Candidatus Adiutrix sp.]|jgi:hypothetical protein|nr:DUF4422 domain-containing protein [Candidatus Adiutrix sp.]